jgi:glutamate-ammonia-ligase adenylyltransferase
LTAQGVEGPMYRVDMRLRPSGNQGPVAVSLGAFRAYHAEQAWTWEQMALTRARVVAGLDDFRPVAEAAVSEALRPRRAPAVVRHDALEMRRRMLRDLPAQGPWDVKHRAGGQMEVEFVTQVLQLIHCAERPDQRSTTSRFALQNLVDLGVLAAEDGAALIEADHLWRTIQSMLRLTVGPVTAPDIAEASARILLAATGEPTMLDLRVRIDRTAALVRSIFIRHIGDPAAAETPARR